MQKVIELFKHSGKKNGLDVWVVKTNKPRKNTLSSIFVAEQKPEVLHEVFPVPPRQHGVFHSDNIYIVLKTNSETKQRDLHFWFGKNYKDAPPTWVDNFESLELNWTANQHFEFQGRECELFESYFDQIQPALRYKRGSHPEPSSEKAQGVTRFYKLERNDRKSYRIREIPFNIALMTKEECFILDTDHNTRAYVSDRTPVHDREKSMVLANHIRDLDHEGHGDIELVDLTTFTNEAEKEAYVKATDLLKDVPARNVDFDQPDEDIQCAQLSMVTYIFGDDVDVGYPPKFRYIPKRKKSTAPDDKNLSFCARLKKNTINKLFRRKDQTQEDEVELPTFEEKFTKTATCQAPLKREMLNNKKCYIMEGSPENKAIFVWIGKACEPILRDELIQCLRNEFYICENGDEEHINPNLIIEELGTGAYEKKKDKKVENEIKLTPKWIHFQKVVDGAEPLKFKRYFQDWE